MSCVTGVVLCTSVCEGPTDDDEIGPSWRKVQSWLVEQGFVELQLVDRIFSGNKGPQMIVGGGGFNYFRDDDFARLVISLPWECPENVVLVLNMEEGESRVLRPPGFALYDLRTCVHDFCTDDTCHCVAHSPRPVAVSDAAIARLACSCTLALSERS